MKDLEPLVFPLTEIEAGPIKASTDNISEAYGLVGVVLLIAVGLKLIRKYL